MQWLTLVKAVMKIMVPKHVGAVEQRIEDPFIATLLPGSKACLSQQNGSPCGHRLSITQLVTMVKPTTGRHIYKPMTRYFAHQKQQNMVN